jgi:hypothetical protein
VLARPGREGQWHLRFKFGWRGLADRTRKPRRAARGTEVPAGRPRPRNPRRLGFAVAGARPRHFNFKLNLKFKLPVAEAGSHCLAMAGPGEKSGSARG